MTTNVFCDSGGAAGFAAALAAAGAAPPWSAGLSTRRQASATYIDQNGAMQTAGPGVVRPLYSGGVLQGLLIEAASTNEVLNGSASGAGPGALPTGWTGGGGSGVTMTVIGGGTEAGLPYVDVRFSGTATATNTLGIQFGAQTGIAASSGQTWDYSAFIRVSGGSLAGIYAIATEAIEYNSSLGVVGAPFLAIGPTAAILTANRFSFSFVTPAATAYLWPVWYFGVTSGAAIDVTFRFAGIQVEQGSAATSYVPTSGTAATRDADTLFFTVPDGGPANEFCAAVAVGGAAPPWFAGLSTQRQASATYIDQNGVMQTAGPGVVRPDWIGAALQGPLVEAASANLLPNSTMQGASAGVAPTGWLGFGTVNGATLSVAGTGTEDGIAYVDLLWSGTPTASFNFGLYLGPGTAAPATNGLPYVSSAYLRVAGGSLPASGAFLNQQFGDSSGAWLQSAASATMPGAAPLSSQRFSVAQTAANSGIRYMVIQIYLSLVSGTPVNLTLRVGAPDIEQASAISSFIATSTGPVSRDADTIVFAPPDGGLALALPGSPFADAPVAVANIGTLLADSAPILAAGRLTGAADAAPSIEGCARSIGIPASAAESLASGSCDAAALAAEGSAPAADSGVGAEGQRLLLADSAFPADAGTNTASDQVATSQWLAGTMLDSAGASESRASFWRDAAPPAGAGLALRSDASGPAAAGAAAASDAPDPAEWQAMHAMQLDSAAPGEWRSSVPADVAAPVAWIAPVQSVAAGAADAAFSAAAQHPGPAEPGVAVARGEPVPSEWSGSLGVFADAAAAAEFSAAMVCGQAFRYEARLSLQADVPAAPEAAAAAANGAPAPSEPNAGAAGGWASPLEWGGVLFVFVDAAVRADWLGAPGSDTALRAPFAAPAAIDAGAAPEASGTAAAAGGIASETGAVAAGAAPARAGPLGGVRADLAAPTEWTAHTFGIAADGAFAIEILVALHSDTAVPASAFRAPTQSAARTVLVLYPAGEPLRGVRAVPPPVLWPRKASADVLDFGLDLTGWLADCADALAGAAVSISPSGGADDLAAAAPAISGSRVLMTFAGGVPGTSYRIAVAIGTAAGRSLTLSGTVPVDLDSAATAPPAPLYSV
ncbi:MAG TPA: hypothetical protein VNE67_09090 [Acetobacteraceae bacterium]|nr:hypothetical protein [Acetobacteraceae bacterium]